MEEIEKRAGALWAGLGVKSEVTKILQREYGLSLRQAERALWAVIQAGGGGMSGKASVYDGFYDDGNWYASTLGHFISLLVDAGQDPAVCFRVVSDSEPDDDGEFIRRVEVLMLPNGYVAEAVLGCRGVHKTLRALLEAGVVG